MRLLNLCQRVEKHRPLDFEISTPKAIHQARAVLQAGDCADVGHHAAQQVIVLLNSPRMRSARFQRGPNGIMTHRDAASYIGHMAHDFTKMSVADKLAFHNARKAEKKSRRKANRKKAKPPPIFTPAKPKISGGRLFKPGHGKLS